MARLTFSAGFRYGCGLWLARLLAYIVAVPIGAALLFATITALDLIMRMIGL